MFFVVFKFYLLQKRCSLTVLNMILETPNFKVINIIFESYEHRSKIILQLLTSFVFLKVGEFTVDLSISLQLIVKISIHLK